MSESPNGFGLALWAANMAVPLAGPDDVLALLDERLREAREGGAALLVLPEYISEHWLAYAPAGMNAAEEGRWMAAEGARLAPRFAALAAEHDMGLMAGTWPVEAADRRLHNTAFLWLPDGREIRQAKLCLTPDERDGWRVSPADHVTIVEWRGIRLAVLICLDIELPALSARLADEAIDLILVPSMTERLAGWARVFTCAKARAVELMSAVGVVGCIGSVEPGNARPNVSGAAIYVPCEEALGMTGVLAEIAPTEAVEGPGPLLVVPALPIGTIRALRAGRAEVWPGRWEADHVSISHSHAGGRVS
ncbi:nitrilase-related carbon-nitrogen hydrolase [Marinivivus vitaminiproducens]|uniref:nitrilase-related carbon-nitrogen hydrolase n=1 Tax=Marinivivus vitaminiproducens TaxID=3035935 RepID=UPI0027983F1F|nr:nitrilase-related carbon-nitrogen hydrolase [Geminicoccaceae bacterium SCSIO 64248]